MSLQVSQRCTGPRVAQAPTRSCNETKVLCHAWIPDNLSRKGGRDDA